MPKNTGVCAGLFQYHAPRIFQYQRATDIPISTRHGYHNTDSPVGRQSGRPCFTVCRRRTAVWLNHVRADDFNQSGGDRIAGQVGMVQAVESNVSSPSPKTSVPATIDRNKTNSSRNMNLLLRIRGEPGEHINIRWSITVGRQVTFPQ